MGLSGIAARLTVSLLLALCACMTTAAADFHSPMTPPSLHLIAESRSGPPFSIGGFTYRPAPQGIHMNVCTRPSCGMGSKVSYKIYRPDPALTFEAYKSQRAMIEKELKARTPPGVAFKVHPPTRKQSKLVTIFESRRALTAPDGRTEVTVSRTLQTKTLTIDLISSGSDEKLVDLNLDQFTLAAMALTQIRKDAKP